MQDRLARESPLSADATTRHQSPLALTPATPRPRRSLPGSLRWTHGSTALDWCWTKIRAAAPPAATRSTRQSTGLRASRLTVYATRVPSRSPAGVTGAQPWRTARLGERPHSALGRGRNGRRRICRRSSDGSEARQCSTWGYREPAPPHSISSPNTAIRIAALPLRRPAPREAPQERCLRRGPCRLRGGLVVRRMTVSKWSTGGSGDSSIAARMVR